MIRHSHILLHICNILSLLCLIFHVLLTHGVEGRISIPTKLEIKRYLKKINKPAVKSFKGDAGEVIDCVDIYKQPAFDHPLLRNHTIQMEPSFIPSGTTHERKASNVRFKTWNCPQGTIPIRRVLESDILRASSLTNFGKKPSPIRRRPQDDDDASHVYAIVYRDGRPYSGSNANINLWNPKVEPMDASMSQLWVADKQPLTTTLEAGLTVHPSLYGDHKTRLFIYWTADGYGHTGCYNMDCPGFVQTNIQIALGTDFRPVSVYGRQQHHVTFSIRQNSSTHNWHLIVENKDLGYWPREIIPALQNGAKFLEWGGEIVNKHYRERSTTTQMGSGHFAGEGYRKAAYFTDAYTYDANGTPVFPRLTPVVTSPHCYDLQVSPTRGSFYYGGPGKSNNCP